MQCSSYWMEATMEKEKLGICLSSSTRQNLGFCDLTVRTVRCRYYGMHANSLEAGKWSLDVYPGYSHNMGYVEYVPNSIESTQPTVKREPDRHRCSCFFDELILTTHLSVLTHLPLYIYIYITLNKTPQTHHVTVYGTIARCL